MDTPIIQTEDPKPTLNVQLFRCGLKIQVSEDMRIFGPWLDEVVADMTKTTEELKGVGLAAPQVNIYKRIAVILIKGERLVLINPHIESLSKEKFKVQEGCFSLPNYRGVIERSKSLWIRTQIYEKGQVSKEPNLVQFHGFWAQVIQHEVDHLDGKLFIDHLSRLKRNMFLKKYDEFIRYSKMRQTGEMKVLEKEAVDRHIKIQGERRRHWGAAPPKKVIR
jgi:peptide deformylase